MKKKLSEKQAEFSHKLGVFLVWIYSHPGWGVTLGEANRPIEMQRIYIEQGKSWTFGSKHLKRLAIDLNLFIDGKYTKRFKDYQPLGRMWEMLGGRWGGSFGDAGHFEYGK